MSECDICSILKSSLTRITVKRGLVTRKQKYCVECGRYSRQLNTAVPDEHRDVCATYDWCRVTERRSEKTDQRTTGGVPSAVCFGCSNVPHFCVQGLGNSRLKCGTFLSSEMWCWSGGREILTELSLLQYCGACRRKWRLSDTDLCHCGETQTMSHIVKSCPLTKLNGG